MKMQRSSNSLTSLFVSLFATSLLLCSSFALAEPTLPEVYQTIESGQLGKADVMMQEVFQPESVRRLQAQLRTGVAPATTANAGAGSIFSSPIFWILMAILIGGIMFFMKNRQQPVQVYNAPTANGPYPGAPGAYPPGYPPAGYPGAPTSGMGGGLMGSLATGAALGAGMVAGEALASHLMGGGEHMNPGSNNGFNQVGGQVPDAANFGVNDASSWDDGSSNSWDDGGGGDFMSDV